MRTMHCDICGHLMHEPQEMERRLELKIGEKKNSVRIEVSDEDGDSAPDICNTCLGEFIMKRLG
jgi:hypothetical protein